MADDDKTFTQAEVNDLIRDRLARERAKYTDYDDLKAKAEAADKNQTQLDKVQEQLAGLTQRAEKAEAENLRSTVARELGLTDRQARRLSGKTREELVADGKDMLEDFAPKGAKDDGKGDDGKDDDSGDDGKQTGTPPAAAPAQRGRPKESLRTGAPITGNEPEETNPLKLAALIPRN